MRILLKQNKLFTFLLVLTIIIILIGLLLPSLLKEEDKKEITENILILQEKLEKNTTIKEKKNIGEEIATTFLIWLLGISIIGIPIILLIYGLKVLITFTELTFLLIHLKQIKISMLLIYCFPQLIKILLDFFLVYYSLNYSIFLIKLLFLKEQYPIKLITTKYLKILGICTILIGMISILEIYAIPKLINF